MVLLVASDTHGRTARLAEAVKRAGARYLLFLGDGAREADTVTELPVIAVRGNCDFGREDLPLTRVECFSKYRIFMTHGHTLGVKSSPEAAIGAAAREGADVLLYGHTHVPYEAMLPAGRPIMGGVLQKPLLVVCPGSLGEPHDGIPTFATLTVRENGILAGFGKLSFS